MVCFVQVNINIVRPKLILSQVNILPQVNIAQS